MARIKFGDGGIQLEAALPEPKLAPEPPVEPKVVITVPEVQAIDLKPVHDRIDNINAVIGSIGGRIHELESKKIVHPEVKQIVYNRDHSDELEQLDRDLQSTGRALVKMIKKQKRINIAIGIVAIASLMSHLL